MRSILQSLKDLVASWWQVDRIRSSPRLGRLLRITPGSSLSVRGELSEVIDRLVHETSRGPLVCYEMRCGQNRSKLWIAPESAHVIVWVRDGCEEQLLADEIEVWGHDGSCFSEGILNADNRQTPQ